MAKKKNKKAKQKKLVTMDCDQLENEGNLLLESKNARKAIKLLKSALKKAGEPAQKERIKASLFASYLAREKELKAKNMQQEAAEVFQQAMEHLPDMAYTTEETLVLLIHSSSNSQAFETCSRFFDHHKPSQRITRLLGEKLVAENCWDLLDRFDNLAFLKSGADLIEQAAALMNRGKWEAAKDVMQSLPRSSPFFNVRMFCRAMVSFYADNDADMVKALATIDENSLFTESAAALKACVTPGPGEEDGTAEIDSDNSFLPLFYKTGFDVQHRVTALINHLKKRGYNAKCAGLIQELAGSLYPECPGVAVFYLLETVWSRDEFFSHPEAEESFFGMIKKSLPKTKAEYLTAKIQILLGEDILSDTATFLKLAEKEFFDSEERAIAKSTAILKAVATLHADPDDYCLYQVASFEKKRLGITSDDLREALLEMAYHGVTLDRYNRELFEAAAALPCRSRNAQKIKEKIFVLMGEVFPRDPYPCLELATLYHGKNAYRKAENILEKAKKIAPHDQRVLDKHVISLLISADRNIARTKFHLAWNDLEKAEAFQSRNCDLLIKEKQLFSRIVEKPEIPIKALKIKLNSFDSFSRARLAAMVLVDITRAGKKQNLDKAKTKVSSLFNKKNFKDLTSSEAAALLMPLPGEWQTLFPPPGIAPVLLDNFDGFLNLLDDGDLFEVIDRIGTPEKWDIFIDQLDQRVTSRNQREEPRDPRMEFYLAALENIDNPEILVNDGEVFIEIIDLSAGSDTRQLLETAAAKLSRHASGQFKMALESFDFTMISSPMSYFDSDFDDDFDDDFDEAFPDGIPFPGDTDMDVSELFKMLDSLPDAYAHSMAKGMSREIAADAEHIIDEGELRGLPTSLLKSAKKELMSHGDIRQIADFIKEFSRRMDLKLSKEAKILFID